MIGHQQIIELRRAKKKPRAAWIAIDDVPHLLPNLCWLWEHPERALEMGLWPTIYMPNNECATAEVWFLIGMRVHVQCPVITPEVRRLLKNLERAKVAQVACSDGDEILTYEKGEWNE